MQNFSIRLIKLFARLTFRIRQLQILFGLPAIFLSERISTKQSSSGMKYTIKIQYIRKWKPNQIVLMVDNKLVLNLTLTKTDSKEDIKYAIYSSKESVVLCYTTMIEYQSLLSDI